MSRKATERDICSWSPENLGSSLQDGHYAIKWFEGSEVPDDVCSQIDDSTMDSNDGNEEI